MPFVDESNVRNMQIICGYIVGYLQVILFISSPIEAANRINPRHPFFTVEQQQTCADQWHIAHGPSFGGVPCGNDLRKWEDSA